MKWFSKIFKKQLPSRQAIGMMDLANPMMMERSYESFSKEGYKNLTTAYRCINLISDSVAGVKFVLKDGDEEIESHPVIDLLKRPNPVQGNQAFTKEVLSYLMISGNSFIQALAPSENRPPVELHAQRPDRFKIIPGARGIPSSFVFSVSQGKEVTYPVDVMGRSQIMQMKLFNPTNQWWGLSPMEPSAIEIDTLNASSRWNLALLQNSARPSALFMYKGQGELQPDQRSRLKADIEQIYSGSRNAGKALILGGGFDHKELGLSPKDMDFLNSKRVSEKDVALTYGVPGQLVGVEGSQTFANYEQARLAFYVDTVLPLANLYSTHLNVWLLPSYGNPNLRLEIDQDSMAALEPLRKMKWDKASGADWLTPNEKRELTGYAPYEPTADPADMLYQQTSMIPLGLEDDFEELEIDDDEDDDEKNFKVFDVNTARGKRQFWIEQNRKRDRLEKRLGSQISAAFKKELKLLKNAIEGAEKDTIEIIINDVIDENSVTFKKIYEKNLTGAMKLFGRDVFRSRTKSVKAAEDTFTDSIRQFITAQVGDKVTGLANRTKRKVIKQVRRAILDGEDLGLSELQIGKTLEGTYAKFSEGRARVIARTEIHNASLEGSKQAAKALQIPNLQKEWIATLDARVRDSHADINGQKIGIDEQFEVSGENGVTLMDGPGDLSAPPLEKLLIADAYWLIVRGE